MIGARDEARSVLSRWSGAAFDDWPKTLGLRCLFRGFGVASNDESPARIAGASLASLRCLRIGYSGIPLQNARELAVRKRGIR